MTETSTPVTWLTQEAHDRLTSELEQMTGPGRAEIVRKIEAAREEGDLRENGGYHAAKEEQGKQEARIRQLQALLDIARVGERPADSGVVGLGMVVTVDMGSEGAEQVRFLLGSREGAGDGIEVYSERSPLGAAILGHRVGEEASYDAPSGRRITVKIIDATPYTD